MKHAMTETITHTWQTVEQAAVTLNVSTRTIARRLASGGLESRVDENGRRLVLVQQIGQGIGGPDGVDGPSDASDTVDEYVDTHLSAVAAPLPPAESRQAQTLAVLNVLETTLIATREDAGRARRSAKWAWAGVGAMAFLTVGSAVLVSSTMTRSIVTNDMLRQQLAETKADLKQSQSELIATHTAEAQATRELTDARRAVETARQQPVAVATPAVTPSAPPQPAPATPVAAKPTTQPTLFGRVVGLFAE